MTRALSEVYSEIFRAEADLLVVRYDDPGIYSSHNNRCTGDNAQTPSFQSDYVHLLCLVGSHGPWRNLDGRVFGWTAPEHLGMHRHTTSRLD